MTRPPAFVQENFGYRRSTTLAAFAKPTSASYFTRPLSRLGITIVKQLERVELHLIRNESSEQCRARLAHSEEHCTSLCPSVLALTSSDSKDPPGSGASNCFSITFAGYGVVNVKRSVHGYKKLSVITRAELSRTELSLPDMEFESFGLWFDTDAGALAPLLGEKYGRGVHALSHAILAVAPLFAPGLVRSDVECDHAYVAPTRIVLFDERAGGSGSSERLWKHFFQRESILESAILLLEECSSCCWDTSYDVGCPACLHASNCVQFNTHLSRFAAIVIGKHLLDRIQATELFKGIVKAWPRAPVGMLEGKRSRRPRKCTVPATVNLWSGGHRGRWTVTKCSVVMQPPSMLEE
jgi:ATP-dependent helicase YprA (DUF1998 family)